MSTIAESPGHVRHIPDLDLPGRSLGVEPRSAPGRRIPSRRNPSRVREETYGHVAKAHCATKEHEIAPPRKAKCSRPGHTSKHAPAAVPRDWWRRDGHKQQPHSHRRHRRRRVHRTGAPGLQQLSASPVSGPRQICGCSDQPIPGRRARRIDQAAEWPIQCSCACLPA